MSEEVSIGYLPAEWIAGAMQKTLSPQGRFVLVTPTGPIRISDTGEKIDAARRALAELQKAPALVPVELSFTTSVRRVVQRLPAEQPVHDYGIPVPNRYDPPRVIANPGGGFTVVPAQPRDFTTRNVGPGTIVNPSPTGYRTLSPEVRISETTTSSGVARRFSASTVPGKPVAFTVLKQVPDVAALREVALKHKAIAESEPAWSAAGTELLVKPELSGGALMVTIVPQIVIPAAAPAQARRIPINACAAGVLVARGAPANTGMLPRTDPEFYRLFFGNQEAVDDSVTALTVTASVQYLGSQPR